ncbi:MAG: helix-turn-helix domain-containing protein [Candidatus Eremiobacteraeota bacterium]|nr:helix-turn-helix domain-containing protein [Candidatus Eremiobacteraeota bacterium]
MITPQKVRQAIIRAHERNLTYEQIAELLGVGRATVSRTLRLYRETGDVERRPAGGGNFSIFHDHVAELLLAIVETMPDASIRELTRAFEQQSKLSTSTASIGRALRRLGYSRKKRLSAP